MCPPSCLFESVRCRCSPRPRAVNRLRRRMANLDPAVAANNALAICTPLAEMGILRYAEFWYEDGSIVLVTQNSGFCIYSDWLTQRSKLFYERLATP